MNRALAGERAMSLAALENPRQLVRALAAPDLKINAARRTAIKARVSSGEGLEPEKAFFQSACERIIAARKAPFPERLKADADGAEAATEAEQRGLVALELLLPSLGRRTALEGGILALLRLASTALALETFARLHENEYPSNLQEIPQSGRWIDPFTGTRLSYKKRKHGFVLGCSTPEGEKLFTLQRNQNANR